MNSNNAIVLLDKGPDVTSFECLKYVKRCVNKKTGHCGTLDKFATGLIIALCGKYTKLNPVFMGMDKVYEATVKFGQETDTLDPEGQVIKTGIIPDYDTVVKAIEILKGDLLQIPPVYSALHVNGQRSYSLARKGKEVKLDPRPVTVYSAELISYDNGLLKIKLKVSKGTYIRSYARDLGYICNSCAHLIQLCRTQIGPFRLENAVDYRDESALSLLDEESSASLLEMLENYRNDN